MNDSNRRNFLKSLGLTAATALASNSVMGSMVEKDDILKLNPEQQKFMLEYGQWMDENIVLLRKQKEEPDNIDLKHQMMKLSERAEGMQDQLVSYMKDRDFGLIYNASIQKMRDEIIG
ncbi:MAG: twin-arginine translocation signal domain-containing protein [Bacteroidia bacterium]|nr:twin-arginine translocation signal domain-containing protein [Bacteroidia bacterium]MCF8425552.1 twin-arginine translocation signal domain-containing protein [Bacteroidia bacterium]MCF8445865.1 twin-arginine translocation signal domain-containing protein [Bacteroidia bacterium]